VRFIATPATSEFVRRSTLQSGDIVSFKHTGFLQGTKQPKLPALYRIRQDLTWDEVIENWKEEKPRASGYIFEILLCFSLKCLLTFTPSFTGAPYKFSSNRYPPPREYWRSVENRRKFLLEFAKSAGFDPYKLSSWSKVTKRQIYLRGVGCRCGYVSLVVLTHLKKGGGLLKNCQNSLRLALKMTFPKMHIKERG